MGSGSSINMSPTSACYSSESCGNAQAQQVESQRLLMPLVIELTPAQQAIFSDIAEELARNGFEAEPFGARSVAVKVAPAGVDAAQIEHMLNEIFEQLTREDQAINLEAVRTRIAASIACHAAIKVNMPLEQNKMEWLLAELAKTEHPMTCPHGRPVVLRYSMQDIQKAFKTRQDLAPSSQSSARPLLRRLTL